MRKMIPLFGLLGLLLIFSVDVGYAQEPVDPTPDPAEVLECAETALGEAERLLDVAQGTVEQSSNVLDYVQVVISVVAIVAALVGGAFTVFGIRTVRGLDEQKRDLDAYQDEVEALQAQLQEALLGARTAREEARREYDTINEMRLRADHSIRALTLFQLGRGQVEARDLSGALATFEHAHALDADNPTVNYMLAEVYLQMGREVDQAIEHLDLTLAVDEEYAPALAAKGYALRLKANQTEEPSVRDRLYAQAEGLLLGALVLQPDLLDLNDESYHALLGGLYRRRGLLQKAIEAYEEAERVTPQNPYPVGNLAILYAMQGDEQKAAAYFKRSSDMATRKLEATPRDHWAMLDRALGQLCLGEMDTALESYRQIVEHITLSAPLKAALDTLHDLQAAPHPPAGIEQAIAILEAAIGD